MQSTTFLLKRALIVTSSLLLAITTLILGPPSADAAVTGGVLHVATTGSDAAAGTSNHPLATVAAAVSRAQDGSTIIVHGGSYHESLTVEGVEGLTIQAAVGAEVWLDGSRPITDWVRTGTMWVLSGWTAEFDASPTYTPGAPDGTDPDWQFVNPAHPMAAHPDQMWIDGRALRQVGSLAEVGPNTFYADDERDKLYTGTDPSGHDVRASDLAKAISIRAAGTTVAGIGVHGFATSVPLMGTITVEAPDVTLTDMRITDNATTGVHVMAPGVTVQRVVLARNGMMGMTATEADGLQVRGVRVRRNNAELFNPAPSAGGLKIDRSSEIMVRDSTFVANHGTGLWFDESVYRLAVVGSRMAKNDGHGLALEISGSADVVDNLIVDNAGDGIKINDTDHVRVWNNTLARNGRPLNVVQDGRDVDLDGSYRDWSLPLTYRNGPISLSNNVVAAPRSSANCLLCVEDYSGRFSAEDMQVSALGNLYQRTREDNPGWAVVWSVGPGDPAVFDNLAAFRAETGQENPGKLLTGRAAVSASNTLTSVVRRLRSHVALPVPTWLAELAGVREGARHLGSWRR